MSSSSEQGFRSFSSAGFDRLPCSLGFRMLRKNDLGSWLGLFILNGEVSFFSLVAGFFSGFLQVLLLVLAELLELPRVHLTQSPCDAGQPNVQILAVFLEL